MKAIHLICRRKEDGHLEGLSFVGTGMFESCCWVLRDVEEAQSLVGGWAYLHPTGKNHRSEFGGIVRAVRPAVREDKAVKDGFTLVIKVRHQGRGQQWRGAAHGMAWHGPAGLSVPTYRMKGQMMPKGPKGEKRPADIIGASVLIARIATGEAEDALQDDGKDKAAQAMGQKGGKARAASMTSERRAEIARKAAAKRWGSKQ